MKEFNSAKEGSIAWEDKFKRQNQGAEIPFKPGEKIYIKEMTVQSVLDENGHVDKTKITLMVDEGSGGKQTDIFRIDVTPELHKALMQSPGNVYEGVLQIQGSGRGGVSNVFQYSAKDLALRSSMLENPNSDAVQKLEMGTNVLAKGKVISITEIPGDRDFLVTLKTDQGKNVDVVIDKSVKFETSPGLENGEGKTPRLGDVVQISGSIRKAPEGLTNHIDGVKELKAISAPWCRSTYLMEPSPSRLHEFNELRKEVTSNMKSLSAYLDAGDYKSAREFSSKLMNSERTAEETKKVIELQSKFPDKEKPIILYDRYDSVELNKTFGVDIDSMTREEFKKFAMQKASSPFTLDGVGKREGDESYIYRVMDDLKFSPSEQESILTKAIDTRLEYFKKIEASGEKLDYKKHGDDNYFLDRSITHLSGIQTISAAEKMLSIARDMMKDPQNELNHEFLFCVTQSLMYLSYDSSSNKDPKVFEHLKKSLPEIESWMEKLNGMEAPTNEGSLENLTRVSQVLQPKYEGLRSDNFENNIKEYLNKFSEANAFMKRFATEVEAKGYEIKLMNQRDESIPIDIRQMADEKVGAITVPSRKEIYLNLPALENIAHTNRMSLDSVLINTLANEAVHVIESTKFTPLNSKETSLEIDRMKETPNKFIASEKMFHKIIIEEVVSEFAGQAVQEQFKNPNYKLDGADLKISKPQFATIAGELGPVVLSRYYNFADGKLTEEDAVMLSNRLVKFLQSKSFEEGVHSKLKSYGLLNE